MIQYTLVIIIELIVCENWTVTYSYIMGNDVKKSEAVKELHSFNLEMVLSPE